MAPWNGPKKQQQRNAIGTQYTQNSLAYILHSVIEHSIEYRATCQNNNNLYSLELNQ